MRLVTFFIAGILLFNLNSCASQSDPVRKEKGKGLENSNTAPRTKGLDKKPTKTEIMDDVKLEEESVEEEMGMSIISYENIQLPAKDEKIKADEVPVEGQKVKLMIQNNHSTAMWYLMPASGEKEMPEDGQFALNTMDLPPFLAKKYKQNNQHLVELIFNGAEAQSFRAFYVEAGQSLLFRNYDLGTYNEGDYVPFWSAKYLQVNAGTRLESWLPFEVSSSPNVVINSKTEQGAVLWDNLTEKAVFPEEAIEFIQASKIKRYQIPVGVIR